ncbi:MAG: transketolase [Microbacteriaceae bacterium]|nr:transketolase [Microbacteriaceae bacterium]
MLAQAGSGHSAGPLGMAEIIAVMYFHTLRHDPARPDDPDRDIFILSHGHTAPILYAAMAHAGYFPTDELMTLRRLGSRLQGHPERTALPGLETTSGPLGCGLSQGAGIAYVSEHLDRSRKRFVYVAMGDGELNEGNIWEAAMFAAKYRLGNLIGLVDRNYIQIDGRTEEVMPLDDLAAKWRAFGWHTIETDGNSVSGLLAALGEARAVSDRPSAIIAHTVPGRGVDFMEYDYRWHGKPPTKDQALSAIDALEADARR